VTPTIEIEGRRIGPAHPVYVIAEVSANHGGSLRRALELVRVAADCGADAVKLQTYTPDTMTLASDRPEFVVGPGNPWSGRRLHDLYAEAAMPWEWYGELADEGRRHGITVFSSPFDASAVDFLVAQGAPALKIASFELTDLPLVRAAAATGLPLVMSTGMATADEIDAAVATATTAGAGGVALLRCNSAYPSPPQDMDLRTIPHMASRWVVPVGLSDHTLDDTAAVAAVALGASIVEKHVTMDRADGGPDASFSLEPDELARLVAAIRTAEAALGTVRYGPSDSDRASLAFRRSLFVVAPVRTGERFTSDNVRVLRPAVGLAPEHLDEVLGRVAPHDYEAGDALTAEVLA
jgi:N-acetylneuraminate synthase